MKAIVYTEYGSPEVLRLAEVDKPMPRENEVLVKIHATSVNSWDWDQLRGNTLLTRLIAGLKRPRRTILGADIAGRIESTGSGAKDFKPGDEVFGDIAGAGFGGFAEYVAVSENLLAKKPQALSFNQAAALPQAGLLALQGLRYRGEIQPGQHILLNGAGGGVGTLALQYAKSIGAEVTCVDRPDKFDMLRSLGADHVIDYTKEDYTRLGIRYDKILDVVAHRSMSDYRRALKPGGTFAMIGGSMGGLLLNLMLLGPVYSKFGKKNLGIMGYRPNRVDLEYLGKLAVEGRSIPVIDKVYPLEEVPAAIQYLGNGNARGKVVISIIPDH